MDQSTKWTPVAEQADQESPLPAETPRRSPLKRILTGLGAGVFVLTCIFLPEAGGLPFVLACAAVGITAMSEFFRAVRKQGAEPSDVLGFLACILFQFAAWRRDGNSLDPYLPGFLTLLVLVAMFVELIKPKQKPILNIGSTLLGAIYCGWMLGYLVLMHGSHLLVRAPIAGTTPGMWLTAYVVAVTSFNDIGGLVFGAIFGRRKLAPSISPKKTWEGALGGVLSSILVAWLLGLWIHFPTGPSIALGAILAVAGLLGDLCESALKRELGVKDFGMILPGHGGILDRIDSMLFAAPVAYYFCLALVHGMG